MNTPGPGAEKQSDQSRNGQDGSVTVFLGANGDEKLARYELGEQFMASPIPIGDDLILRTKTAVYRFANTAEEDSKPRAEQ